MKSIFIVIFILITGISLFSARGISSLNKSERTENNIDKFIKTDTLNKKTLIVRMGSDAVTAFATQKGIVVIVAGISTGLTKKIPENHRR